MKIVEEVSEDQGGEGKKKKRKEKKEKKKEEKKKKKKKTWTVKKTNAGIVDIVFVCEINHSRHH